MGTIRHFEDLIIWQKARELCADIDKIIREGEFVKDYKFRDQINGSSGSIMDNIAEGFERGGRNEFIQFLCIAKGSCGEVKSQLYRAVDRGYVSKQKFQELSDKCTEIAKLLNGLVVYLKNSDFKGIKYKNQVEEPSAAYLISGSNFKISD